jgi:predicted metal-dependent HD superfamily phosphohydrolase
MKASELLSDVWHDLTRHQACPEPAAQAVLDELVQAYSEPHRHYHTIEHVASLLRLLNEHERRIFGTVAG